MSYTVGSVPYLNAKPLVRLFEERESPVRVVYDVPSRLPPLLAGGEAQAILVSSIESLRHPRLFVADDVAIASRGEVMSVRLFSRKPFDQIRRLALDASSMTSNALARIILRRCFGAEPECSPQAPNLDAMLQSHDAALLIGDNGMQAAAGGLEALDLGAAWRKLTGLPFVWALWVGDSALSGDLGDHLREARSHGEANLDRIAREESAGLGLEEDTCVHYLTRVMTYRFGPEERAGLDRFRDEARALGLLEPTPALSV